MLVTGGNNGINQFIGTAEYINVQLGNNTAPMPDIQLPKPTSEHAIIKMNKTTAFLISGVDGTTAYNYVSNETYYLMSLIQQTYNK